MSFCFNCFKKIESLRKPCPFCGAPPIYKSDTTAPEPDPDLIKRLDEATESEKQEIHNKFEIERLMRRGIECFNNGKAYLATKNRQSARKDFQRALKYFEQILKIDPGHRETREYRSKCLLKMP